MTQEIIKKTCEACPVEYGGFRDLPQRLLETDNFVTRDHCGVWIPEFIGLSIWSNIMIAVAYLIISLIILFSKKMFGERLLPSKQTNLAFALFVFCCGVGHAFHGISFWVALYDHITISDTITAIVSWLTIPLIIWWGFNNKNNIDIQNND